MHQKFRLCMLGHYIMSCDIIMCNTCETWGLIYSCTMRTCLRHSMCYRTCTDVMCTSCGACTQAGQPPYVHVARQELLMDMPFMQAKIYISKITASHFRTLNTKFANQNVLKRILIAMHNRTRPIAMRTSGYVQRNL